MLRHEWPLRRPPCWLSAKKHHTEADWSEDEAIEILIDIARSDAVNDATRIQAIRLLREIGATERVSIDDIYPPST